MKFNPIIFVGPSLTGFDWPSDLISFLKPPAACGDILVAAHEGASHILLIDGYFESRQSVWHKEILWAMEQGVLCMGAASMGALRAAELQAYGMIGIGIIFDCYLSGSLTGDDEVAVTHGPAELGYCATSEALVNVRATLRAACVAGGLTKASCDALIIRAQDIFFKDRTWGAILNACQDIISIPDFQPLIDAYYIDQKRQDALQAIGYLRNWQEITMPEPVSAPRTSFLLNLLARQEIKQQSKVPAPKQI
jgi:hypothetical protein